MARKRVIDLDTYNALDAWAIALHEMYRAKMKQQPHKVYLLIDYNYVGTTHWINKRFSQHNYSKGWDCSNYKILTQ